jgi:hypothetical protein
MTAVIALHLNAWDKEIGTKTSRIVYAVLFITWAFLPMFLSKDTEHIHITLVPLYIAVSNYAFRNWELAKNQSGLGKKSKIIIAAFIIIPVLISISIPLYISYNVRTLKFVCTENQRKFLYKVPVERKIADIGNRSPDNVKVSYANFEMTLPFKKFERICYGSLEYKNKFTSITIDSRIPKGIIIEIPLSGFPSKDKNGKEPLFEKHNRMLYMTPDKISLLKDSEDQYKEKLQLLITKSLEEFYVGSGSIYKFETSYIKGFEFINPELIKKSKHIKVEIFDKNDNQYELKFIGFSQEEIDYVLSSMRMNGVNEGSASGIFKGIRVGRCVFMDSALARKYKENLGKEKCGK